VDYTNEGNHTIEASFTPDSKYVVSGFIFWEYFNLIGSEDGTINIWNIEGETERQVAKLEGHCKPSTCVKFSPSFVMMASGCKNLIFWQPKDFK
jgi:WD40 repeat protein